MLELRCRIVWWVAKLLGVSEQFQRLLPPRTPEQEQALHEMQDELLHKINPDRPPEAR